MATRYMYKPVIVKPYVEVTPIEFVWESGMSLSQKRFSSLNLRNTIKRIGLSSRTLECSRASTSKAGLATSAFNLEHYSREGVSVETYYQSSKVLKNSNTGELIYLEGLISKTSMDAKVGGNKRIPGYYLYGNKDLDTGEVHPVKEAIHFYNYNYIKSAVTKMPREDLMEIFKHDAFVDIMLAWGGGAVTACQAHAIATMIGLIESGNIAKAITSYRDYKELL